MRKYFSKNKTNLESLLSINHRVWVAWYPVQHHSPETLLQQDRGSLHQVASLFSLILSGVSGKSTAKLSKLLESNLVPAPQRLCHDGDELDPLLPAQLLSVPALVVERHCHSMPWSCRCPSSGGCLERMGDGDIKGGVKPSCPVGEEHIGWSTVVAWKESTALLQGSKDDCCIKRTRRSKGIFESTGFLLALSIKRNTNTKNHK